MKKGKFFGRIVLISALASAFGSAVFAGENDSTPADAVWAKHVNTIMNVKGPQYAADYNKYVDAYNRKHSRKPHKTKVALNQGIQVGCEPIRVIHKTSGAARGVAILFEGYFACPNQFIDIPSKLAAEGYDVFVPTIIGHGAILGKHDNAGKYMPMGHSTYRTEYMDIRHDSILAVNIAKAYSKDTVKVVGGLSGGGAIAMNAVLESPMLFDRALLMAPFLSGPRSARVLTKIGAKLDMVWFGWGQKCRDANSFGEFGRAGYCDFKMGNIYALQLFTDYVRGKADALAATRKSVGPNAELIKTQVQLVGAVYDHAVDNSIGEHYLRVLAKLHGGENANVDKQVCFIDKQNPFKDPAPHAFPAVYDNLDSPMYWRSTYMKEAVDFITKGEFFEQAPKKKHFGIKPLPLWKTELCKMTEVDKKPLMGKDIIEIESEFPEARK